MSFVSSIFPQINHWSVVNHVCFRYNKTTIKRAGRHRKRIIMDENRIGQFIAQMRKENNMTQKDLANLLHITDKAVSKWERGLSCPDIALLTPIADILGVTTGELLNGKKEESTPETASKSVDNALYYAAETTKRKMVSFRNIAAAAFSASLLLGIAVCIICDIAITGKFTWSLYVISSCLFTWLICFPPIKYGTKGILCSFTVFSILLIPFLYVLSRIIGENTIMMPISIRVSLLSIAWLWCAYLICRRFRHKKLTAAAFSLLSAIPLCIAINVSLASILSEPPLDVWDIFSCILLALLAGALLFADSAKNRRQS